MRKVVLKDSRSNPIHIYVYEPTEKIKGIVHIIHGASEHFARYGLFAEYLNQSGYLVIGCDMLGHGLSTETTDYVHFADKEGSKIGFESILLVKDYILEHYKDLPVYIMGHSMGSFLARKMLIEYPDIYKKGIISGTAYVPGVVTTFGILLTGTIGLFKGKKYVSEFVQNMAIDANPAKMKKDGIIGDFKEAWLTKDETIQQYYHHSAMCGQPFTVTANMNLFEWLAFVNSKSNIRKAKKETPLFFVSGKNDPLSNYGDTVIQLVSIYKKLGFKSIQYKLYENDRHEILNETDHDVVFKDLLDFLNK
ncbi:MAG: alpha/beta fold hydrolase [Candidatus Izemoplasmatales bacterium]